MDFRKFLKTDEARVLPYFGGTRVDDASRRYAVDVQQPPGWYRFSFKGRVATIVDNADAIDLEGLEAVRGHFAHGWLFSGGRQLARVELVPAEEPALLSPVIARRWHSGDLVFDALEFESEAEDTVRQALEDVRGIDEIKGVAASLRAAFAFALVTGVGRALDIAVSPREIAGAILELASGGREVATSLLLDLEERRRLERVRVQAWDAAEGRVVQPRSGWQRPRGAADAGTPIDRATRALDAAGADLVGSRSLGNGMLEVTYRFMGERFISVVDEVSLQVIDAGICLSGSDREVTLESLPSVIREGFDTAQLNITRRA